MSMQHHEIGVLGSKCSPSKSHDTTFSHLTPAPILGPSAECTYNFSSQKSAFRAQLLWHSKVSRFLCPTFSCLIIYLHVHLLNGGNGSE